MSDDDERCTSCGELVDDGMGFTLSAFWRGEDPPALDFGLFHDFACASTYLGRFPQRDGD